MYILRQKIAYLANFLQSSNLVCISHNKNLKKNPRPCLFSLGKQAKVGSIYQQLKKIGISKRAFCKYFK